jgi:hypothetical protein
MLNSDIFDLAYKNYTFVQQVVRTTQNQSENHIMCYSVDFLY